MHGKDQFHYLRWHSFFEAHVGGHPPLNMAWFQGLES